MIGPYRLEDGFVALVDGEFDLDRAVVEELGGAVAGNLVSLVPALPGESDRLAAVFDIEARLERPEGDFAVAVVADRIIAEPQRSR